MRLIKIETAEGVMIVNTSQICRIFVEHETVFITTGDDGKIATLFTDIDHAVDYMQRAPSCSMNMT